MVEELDRKTSALTGVFDIAVRISAKGCPGGTKHR
jgi:hypothetical protein